MIKALGHVFFAVVFLFIVLPMSRIYAADLSNASATLSTSRPSPSSPLSSNASSSDSTIDIFANGSRFLASDSAKIIRTAANTIISNGISVASQSAALTAVYLNNTVGSNAVAGTDVFFSPITAMHTITFAPATNIPVGGTIVISYPGAADNSASPSATTFAFNDLSSSNIQANFSTGSSVCTFGVSSPNISCTVSGADINPGTIVTILIGCSAQSSGTCTTQVPTLINPTKSNQTAGNADIWKVRIRTTDGVSDLDLSTLSLATIESVVVRADIDPSLSFTISGISTGTAVNTGNAVGCLQSETTNSGLNSTATEVNLGTLTNSPSGNNSKVGNISAQLLSVSTNSGNGYVITATSSGHLRNSSTGYFLNDLLTPTEFPSNGSHYYGFHACGLDTYNSDIGTTFWNTTASDTNCNSYNQGSTGNICKYGWPTATSSITIASDDTGPIGNAIVAGSGLTSMSYAAGADPSLPPGSYSTIVTYVATPSF